MQDLRLMQRSAAETVIGIAASAGGLEAMSLLAQHLPTNLPCAYVLAQHMSPNHASVLSTLLARETRLAVQTVEDRCPLESGTIYVPIPNKDLVVEPGFVTVVDPSGRTAEPKPSADRLFSSIARAYGERGVGIVLSGTGSDGSYGVQDIVEAGGITIAQDADSSKYDTMPASAAATGFVDLVLSPKQIGQQLSSILNGTRDFSQLVLQSDAPSEYDTLFQMLQARTKVNFRHYKETTVTRRIQRRMIALGLEDYAAYLALCHDRPEELDALYRDLLISVTRFFRDPEQFEALRMALRDVVEGSNRKTVRVWVPGCASGEEAYSIAFLLSDMLGTSTPEGGPRIQIFATDIDDAALARAREAVYPAAVASTLPEEMSARYMRMGEDTVRVRQEIRNLILFSRHNVFQDPPFSDLDLISFRNTLIYFDGHLQEKVMGRLMYGLRPGGLLFLGTSENIGFLEPHFERVNETAKLYRKRSDRSPDQRALARFGMSTSSRPDRRAVAVQATRPPPTIHDDGLFSELARSVAPRGFIVTANKDILRIFGDLSPFVQVTDAMRGHINASALRPELATEAASLIPLCLKNNASREGIWREMDGVGFNRVRLRGFPLTVPGTGVRVVLVGVETMLEEQPQATNHTDADTEAYLAHVERELADAREALQITMEELQTSNEELQSTNEELQSTNEELQSTNEELETSNEELQSTNEELITVNEELLINTEALNRIVSEQGAVLQDLPLPLMILDRRLAVGAASNAAVALFQLSENGGSYGHVSHVFLPPGFPPLAQICQQVISDGTPQKQAFTLGHHASELRVTPFFHKTRDIAGLTVTVQPSQLAIA